MRKIKNLWKDFYERILLSKRMVIESVNVVLKNVCQIEYTRYRSLDDFATNLLAGLIAY